MKKIILLSVLTITVAISIQSQTIVKGKVYDNKTQEIVPFANIFVEKYNIGTCSSENGFFELELPDSLLPCTLQISSIAYKAVQLPVTNKGVIQKDVYLYKNEYSIDAVTVKGTKISSKKILKTAMKNIPKYFHNKQHNTKRKLKVVHYEKSKPVYTANYTVKLNEPAYTNNLYSSYNNLIEKLSIVNQHKAGKSLSANEFSLHRFINVFDKPFDIFKKNPARYTNWSTKKYNKHIYRFLQDSTINNEVCYVVESTFKDSLIKNIKYINRDIFYISQNTNSLIAYAAISYIESPNKKSLDKLSIIFTKSTNNKYIIQDIRFD